MISSNPNAGSILASLAQSDSFGSLTRRVQHLPVPEFICLLEFITAEFQQFLRAIDLINHEALETMLEQLLDAFTLKVGQILQADRTTIFLVDAEKQQLWSKLSQAKSGKSREIRIPIDAGMAGHVVSTRRPLNIPDPYSHPLFNQEIDKQTEYQTRNVLCMPILSSKDDVVAVAQLQNKAGESPFNRTDEEQFDEFSSYIGIILESCQSFYVAARNQRGVKALLQATSSLGRSLDLQETLHSVMEEARSLMKADRSTLFLLSPETDELWTRVPDAQSKRMIEIRIPANRGIVGYVASTGQLLNIPDAYRDPRFDPTTDKRTGYNTRNILCMPVYNSAGELIGATQLINKEQGSFTSSDEAFMRAFNTQAGIALENARLFENVLVEQQYQKDILQSLSDAVISTDMHGRIVTINEAAIALLGCPVNTGNGKTHLQRWEGHLIGRYVWDVVPIETLKMRLEDSLNIAARHYLPEQTLTVGVFTDAAGEDAEDSAANYQLAIADSEHPDRFTLWNESTEEECAESPFVPADRVRLVERSINLTINPLTNPEGGVRGGLVVLEDISQEKRMKTTMYRYMTPGVAEQVMALGEDAMMVGERKDVSILFSDIRGYTTLTENLGAAEVVSLLNQYFETMVEAVFEYEGTLDKFIGDALMAVFGAPLPLTEDHAWMAVQSALEMRRRLAEFNERRILESQPQIRFGIGISSGDVVSGNIGSSRRMDYTVIGDGVNLSSRLEGVTKEYRCDIIISEFTRDRCRDRIWVRELDRIRVKGKHEAVNIYELIGDRSTPLSPETIEFLDIYGQGRQAYLQRDFEQALQHFKTAKKMRPLDRPVEIYLQRSQRYRQNPPPPSWEGIHSMLTK